MSFRCFVISSNAKADQAYVTHPKRQFWLGMLKCRHQTNLWYPCFGLSAISVLIFKPILDPIIATTAHWICQIDLLCDTRVFPKCFHWIQAVTKIILFKKIAVSRTHYLKSERQRFYDSASEISQLNSVNQFCSI